MSGWTAFWIALALLFGSAEAWTRSWRLWPYAAACVVSAVLAILGVAVWLQWIAYALAAGLLPVLAGRLFRIRPR